MRVARLGVVAAVLASLAAPGVARAQDDGDLAAYTALIYSPPGALPPRVYGADARRAPFAIDLRYGRLEFENDDVAHNYGLGLSLPAGTGRFGLTVGATTQEALDPIILLGGDFETTVGTAEFGEARFGIGLLPAFGLGFPTGDVNEGSAFSLSLGLPLSASFGQWWRFTAHVTPAVAYGRISDDDRVVDVDRDESGTRPLIGFGVNARSPRGFGFMVGFQQVIMDGSKPVLGAGISFGGTMPRL